MTSYIAMIAVRLEQLQVRWIQPAVGLKMVSHWEGYLHSVWQHQSEYHCAVPLCTFHTGDLIKCYDRIKLDTNCGFETGELHVISANAFHLFSHTNCFMLDRKKRKYKIISHYYVWNIFGLQARFGITLLFFSENYLCGSMSLKLP